MAPLTLNLSVDGGEWLTSRLAHLVPRVQNAGTYYTGGWVGHKNGMDFVKKKTSLN